MLKVRAPTPHLSKAPVVLYHYTETLSIHFIVITSKMIHQRVNTGLADSSKESIIARIIESICRCILSRLNGRKIRKSVMNINKSH